MTRRSGQKTANAKLVRKLKKLEAVESRVHSSLGAADPERLIHDLHVHQVQLEMQNSELRDAQQRLEDSRAQYADLYDFAPVGYCTLDPAGRIRKINLTGAALLGVPRESLTGRLFSGAAPLKDKRPFYSHMKRCADEHARVTSELTFSLGRRGVRTVQIISDPLRDEHGARAGYRTSLVDISELKRLETQLRLLSDAGKVFAPSLCHSTTLETAARLAVPTLGDLCIVDMLAAGGDIERVAVVFANAKKREELAARVKQHVPRAGWKAPQARVIESGEPMLLAELGDRLGGWFARDDEAADLIRATGIRSLMVVPLVARGRSIGALTFAITESERRYSQSDLGVAQDLANRAAVALDNASLHSEAKSAIAARDATLALVSHDLRNPLGVILMRTALLMGHPRMTERRVEGRKAAESIHRSAERMRRLIQDLLDVSSIEAERLAIERNSEPVAALLQEAVEAVAPLAAQKSICLEVDLSAGAQPDVHCDRDRIQQVLVNLIDNAIKFTSAGGAVTVGASMHGDEVCFSVSDSGAGMAQEDLPHVFDRFWQVQRTARLGTGLGLSIARGVVSAHGGRIWVQSQLDVGTTFRFTLPIAAQPQEQPVRRAEPSPSLDDGSGAELSKARPIVLTIDDDVDVRDALGATLRAAGFDVVPAANGAEALEYLRHAPRPCSIVLDLTMPVMDGWTFLAERNRDPVLHAIPVVVVSGQRDIAERVASADATYLPKPAPADRLISVIQGHAH